MPSLASLCIRTWSFRAYSCCCTCIQKCTFFFFFGETALCSRMQMAGFPYFDNYMTRMLSGKTSPNSKLRVRDLAVAQSRLHRFSSIWVLGDLDSTSHHFWANLLKRSDVRSSSIDNIWSINTTATNVSSPSLQQIKELWAAHPSILKVHSPSLLLVFCSVKVSATL